MISALRQPNIILIIILFFFAVVFYNIKHYFYRPTESICAASCSPLPLFSTREDLVQVLRKEEFKTGAEIGVQTGLYTKHLLSNWPTCTEYHAIDLWKKQTYYMDPANVDDEQHEKYYQMARQRLKKWENIVRYHRNYSNLAVHEIKDDSLDFIYIDARHDYAGIHEDMELYWPKLKCGGVFAGHDFLDAHEVNGQDWALDHKGVRRTDGKAVKAAVIEFASKQKRQVLQTLKETWPSWYLRK